MEGYTSLFGPKHVKVNSPIVSSSSGNSTTFDREEFNGGTGGVETHGLTQNDSRFGKPLPMRQIRLSFRKD